ncbi:hypothetical protein [Candidatus Methanoperedens nitratireducens]|uniref:Uncharacterized protein n=1 Tax=Candidatus Methanoperedens nitratireducens TaxID=1392998 RepID=A0A284VU25_9EURY|nr:hypothetical protein [Candidatus Methanoperedens nitroreducens]SNQ62667.1 hypothetical protein MNV_810009 [Candidatus Methanoperedens nitroreducens]
MEFKEISVPGGIIQQIGHEESLADIAVDVGNADYIYSNIKIDMLYENTLGDIERTLGSVPDFMKIFPKEVLVHDWPSWKMVEEIDMERARYLLSTDELLEEMLGETQ